MTNDSTETKASFWTTLPGVLASIAVVVIAVALLWVGLHHTATADQSSHGPAPQTATAQQAQPSVILTARSGEITQLTQASFHHNTTGTDLALANGQTIPFDRVRQLDFGTIAEDDDDDNLVTVNIALADGHTMTGDTATDFTFKGENSHGPFTILVQDVSRIVFPH